MLRPFSFVKFKISVLEDIKMRNHFNALLGRTNHLTFLGEIPNMPGLCVLANFKDAKQMIRTGIKMEDLEEMTSFRE